MVVFVFIWCSSVIKRGKKTGKLLRKVAQVVLTSQQAPQALKKCPACYSRAAAYVISGVVTIRAQDQLQFLLGLWMKSVVLKYHWLIYHIATLLLPLLHLIFHFAHRGGNRPGSLFVSGLHIHFSQKYLNILSHSEAALSSLIKSLILKTFYS